MVSGARGQWRKSRGGRGGHVPLKNWTALRGTVMHYVPLKFGFKFSSVQGVFGRMVP